MLPPHSLTLWKVPLSLDSPERLSPYFHLLFTHLLNMKLISRGLG